MAIIVEVLSPDAVVGEEVVTETTVISVVKGVESPVGTVTETTGAVDVVKPGGTVVNVGFGTSFPESPYEGQIWIDIS